MSETRDIELDGLDPCRGCKWDGTGFKPPHSVDCKATHLKPCPFCGSDDLTFNEEKEKSFVECNNCGAIGPNWPPCSFEWNSRSVERKQ